MNDIAKYGLDELPEPVQDEALGRTWLQRVWRRAAFARGLRQGYQLGLNYAARKMHETKAQQQWIRALPRCSCGWIGQMRNSGDNRVELAEIDASEHLSIHAPRSERTIVFVCDEVEVFL